MELVEFLRRMIDADEQVARAADRGSCWFDCDDGHSDHHVRHDPARVLREVEAKRRIIDEHPVTDGVLGPCCRTCGELEQGGGIDGEWPCRTLRLLALPYADHPDYRDEWKP